MNTTHMLLSIGMWFSWVQTASGPEAERRLMTDHNSAGGECLKYQPLGAIQWTYRPLGCNWYIALSCEHLVHQQIIFGVKNNAETSFWFRVVINCEPNYHSSLLSFVATCFLEKLPPRGVWSVNFLARQLTGCKSTIGWTLVYIPETSAYQGRVCGVNQSPRIVIHAIRPSWSCRNNFTNISCCLFIQGGKRCLTVSFERSMF